jgi:formylglycine-generating enzyme required for sulfatase activity
MKARTFLMGSDEKDLEKPIHKVTVPDFYMGRYAVTNEEYGRFIKAMGYQEP